MKSINKRLISHWRRRPVVARRDSYEAAFVYAPSTRLRVNATPRQDRRHKFKANLGYVMCSEPKIFITNDTWVVNLRTT